MGGDGNGSDLERIANSVKDTPDSHFEEVGQSSGVSGFIKKNRGKSVRSFFKIASISALGMWLVYSMFHVNACFKEIKRNESRRMTNTYFIIKDKEDIRDNSIHTYLVLSSLEGRFWYERGFFQYSSSGGKNYVKEICANINLETKSFDSFKNINGDGVHVMDVIPELYNNIGERIDTIIPSEVILKEIHNSWSLLDEKTLQVHIGFSSKEGILSYDKNGGVILDLPKGYCVKDEYGIPLQSPLKIDNICGVFGDGDSFKERTFSVIDKDGRQSEHDASATLCY